MKPYCIALALVAVSLSAAQGKNEVPKEIKAAYKAEVAAFAKADWDTFFSNCDPSYFSLDPTGKRTTLAQMKRDVLVMMKGSSSRSAKLTFTGCKTKPGLAEVSFTAIFEVVTPKGKVKTARYREAGTDMWRKRPAGWKEVRTVDKFFGPVK